MVESLLSYQKKVESWAKHDWPAYHVAVSAARKTQAIAFHHHCNSLLSKLQTGSNDCLWWNLSKRNSGFCMPHNRFAPDADSIATYLHTSYCCLQIFTVSLTLPPEVLSVTCKKSWRIKLSMVYCVLSSLDMKKAVGPDGVSP